MAGFKTSDRCGLFRTGYYLPMCIVFAATLCTYSCTPQQTSRRESEREKREAPSQTQYFAESLRATAQFQVFITLPKT
jgi:hypothetical protein